MIFNPVRSLEIVDEVLERLLNYKYDAERPMGNAAIYHIQCVIKLMLVGVNKCAQEILSRRYEWIVNAIATSEKFCDSHKFHMECLHTAAGICKWLLLGEDDLRHWNEARIFSEAITVDEKVYSKANFTTWRLDSLMAYAILAEQYDAGMREFEKYHKFKGLSGALTLRDFGYACCLHRTQGQFEREALLKAGRELLKKNLQEIWLGSGQFVEAAIWLKIVYQHDSSILSSEQLLLRAYDDMPDVKFP